VLDEGGGCQGQVGVTDDGLDVDAGAHDGAVAALFALASGRAVDLVQHRVVDFSTERGLNRAQVGLMPVRGELHLRDQPRRKIAYERLSVLAVVLTVPRPALKVQAPPIQTDPPPEFLPRGHGAPTSCTAPFE